MPRRRPYWQIHTWFFIAAISRECIKTPAGVAAYWFWMLQSSQEMGFPAANMSVRGQGLPRSTKPSKAEHRNGDLFRMNPTANPSKALVEELFAYMALPAGADTSAAPE